MLPSKSGKLESPCRVRNVNTGILPKAVLEANQKEEDLRTVYTLGMEERTTKNRNINPGPGAHEIQTTFPTEKAAATQMRNPPDPNENKGAGSAQTYQNPNMPPTGPSYSFLGRPESDITSKNHLKPKKTRDPGPGHFENKDVQFKKPVTKFSKDSRKDLAKRDAFPAPDVYNPRMV